ncbi:YqaJ viral recombinase family protein [uncultured Comamonas sp.]|uniref:YqaJ viral recombinase family protein n=1 Tax=uncultured Comamonas sp. TaxID=114710 RepID=UPI00259AAFC4|nr:YqaJ viral recombinase family protein [uncultured Comamonas sp.]
MSMQIVNLVQGTPEWHAHRAKHFNASDAPAMMGCSSYKTRSELVKELATGLGQEVDASTQRRFDDGHRFEALARPLAEEIIGEDLSPCVGTNGKFSASFDGLTFMHDAAFEHKTLNKALREAMAEGCTGEDLPLQYRVQMEQQAMVSGCERILFMASEWTGDGQLIEERHCWYYPDPELRAQIIAGWEQLEKDVAAYDPTAERPAPAVAAPMESLPAVVVQVNGALTVGGNLDAFGDALRAFIERIPKKPSTDQEFADAEAATKALKKAEEALAAAEDGALAQISDVELMRRTVADLKNLARTTRLATEKLVAAEKEARRTAIVTGAQTQLDQHVQALNQRLGANWLPRMAGGFGEVIKGKKSLANMEDAVAVALTSAKHEANVLAQRLEANRRHLVQDGTDWIALFADFGTVGAKAEEDFQALAALRINQHKQAETQRLEAERERIRAEEAAKLQAQAAINAAAATQKEAASAQQEPASAEPAAETKVQSAQAAPEVAAKAEGETLTLGQLNTILAPIKVDAAGLAELGFEARKVEKSTAKHYAACDLPAMVQAMIAHLQSVLVTA